MLNLSLEKNYQIDLCNLGLYQFVHKGVSYLLTSAYL
jgi:hypothetical protein